MKNTASGRQIIEDVFTDTLAEVVWGEAEESEPSPLKAGGGVIASEVCIVNVDQEEVPHLKEGDACLYWQDALSSVRFYLPARQKESINGNRAYSVSLADGSTHVVRFRDAENLVISTRLQRTGEFDLRGTQPLARARFVLSYISLSMARWVV